MSALSLVEVILNVVIWKQNNGQWNVNLKIIPLHAIISLVRKSNKL